MCFSHSSYGSSVEESCGSKHEYDEPWAYENCIQDHEYEKALADRFKVEKLVVSKWLGTDNELLVFAVTVKLQQQGVLDKLWWQSDYDSIAYGAALADYLLATQEQSKE